MILMKKALLLVLVLLLTLTPALAGCQPPGENTPPPEETPTPNPVGDENNLYVWWDSDANAMTVISNAIYDFFEANPHYLEGENKKTINPYTPASQDRLAFEMNVVAQTAPNIIRMDHVYISALGTAENVEDLRRFDFQRHKDKFIESTWKGVVYKGETNPDGPIYGIPFDANTIALMYNKDLLNRAGKSVPTTYNELIEAGNAVKSLNMEKVWPYTLSVNDRDNWSTFNFLFWLWRLGGEVLNEDYTQAKFHEQPGIDALNRYIELTKTYQLADPAGYHEGDFASGNLAMIDMGQWWIKGVSESDNFAFAPMIYLDETKTIKNHSGLGLYAISITSEAAGNKNVQLSYEFAEFLGTTPQYQIDFCRDRNFTPSLIQAAEDDYFNDEIHQVFIEQLKIAKARPGVACWPDIEAAIHNALNEVMNSNRSATEALSAAADVVNNLLQKEREELGDIE